MAHDDRQDEDFHIIYINEAYTPSSNEWHTFEVGQTRFNDEALRQAGQDPPLITHRIHNLNADGY